MYSVISAVDPLALDLVNLCTKVAQNVTRLLLCVFRFFVNDTNTFKLSDCDSQWQRCKHTLSTQRKYTKNINTKRKMFEWSSVTVLVKEDSHDFARGSEDRGA